MGGVVGGLVGGLFGGGGGIIGGLMNSMLGNIMNQLADRFGLQQLSQAITNLAGDLLKNGLGALIDSMPLPNFLKDMAKDVIDRVISREQRPVSCECQEAVNEQLGSTVSEVVDNIMSEITDTVEDESENGEHKGNWLMILATALGKASGKHLKEMVDLGKQMGDMDSTAEPEKFAEVGAQFQAASKIFSIFQESISTMLKSIGEGLTSVSRKQ